MMDRYVVATTTAPDRGTALVIAEDLVKRHLAACAQVGTDLRSFYVWKGGFEQSDEVQLQLKTRESLIPEIRDVLRGSHPYELPELVAVPIVAGDPDYLAWMEGLLKKGPRE